MEELIIEIRALREELKASKKEFLTVDEAAELTRFSKGSIYNMVSKGKIPFIKQGGKLLFSSDQLIEWLKSKSTKPLSDDRFMVGDESVRIRRR